MKPIASKLPLPILPLPVPRIVLMLNRRDGDSGLDRLHEQLTRLKPVLQARFAPATVRVGIRAQGFETASIEMRNIAVVDATVEVTWTPGQDLDDVNWSVRGLGAEIGPALRVLQLMAGHARCYLNEHSSTALVFTALRDPSVSVTAFRHWWITQHAPLVMSKSVPPFTSYEQLHTERDLSERLSAEAGVPYLPGDLSDTICLNGIQGWNELIRKAEDTRIVAEDEKGFVNHKEGGLAVICNFI
jgi:hypothetical protein